MILYEMALLNNETNTFSFKAIEHWRNYSSIDFLDLIQFENFFPEVVEL